MPWNTLAGASLYGTLISTTSPSAAATTTISSLDGNTDKDWTIVISGTLAAGGSSSFVSMRPNNDATANYQGTVFRDYNASTDRNSYANGLYVASLLSTTACTIHTVVRLHTISGTKRIVQSSGGFSDGVQFGFLTSGGAWNDTASNITSLVFVWGNSSFTGTVSVYKG